MRLITCDYSIVVVTVHVGLCPRFLSWRKLRKTWEDFARDPVPL